MKASELATALKHAHVNHLRERVQSEQHWRAHLQAGLVPLAERPLGTLVNAEALAAVVDDWLHEVDTLQGLEPVIRQVSEAVIETAGNDDTRVGELLDEQHFEAILELLLRFRKWREAAIHAALNHPLVSEMVSEMLYTGIKNFLLEENALAKLPGVSSMMKLGRKSVVGKAMGGLEENIRVYLRHNIRATLRTGEQWLNQQLTNERIAQLARDGYARLARLKPADAIRLLPAGAVGDITAHSSAIVDHATHLAYSRQLVAAGLHAAVQSLCEWRLEALLQAQNTSVEARLATMAPALAQGAVALDQAGLLAPWVEQALGDFYDSSACLTVLEQALPAPS